MNDIFDFADSPLDQVLNGLSEGDSLKASWLLTALEDDSQDALEEAFDRLTEMQIQLVLDDIPLDSADSQTALRLRREAKLVQQGNLAGQLEKTDPLRLYLEELAQIPVCGDLQVLALSMENEATMEKAMSLCLGRVVELAEAYAGKGVLLLDLIQEGSMGLWQGLAAYNGQPIADYRDKCIRNAMIRAVILQAHETGVGQRLRQAMEDYRSVDEQLLAELGRNPTEEEIAKSMHISQAQVAVVADMVENARSLHRVKNPEASGPMPEEEDQAVEDTAYFQMRQRIADLLSGLSQEDAQLLTMRYGLEGAAPLTPQQTAERLGLTSDEVVAREAAALSKLRKQ